MLNKAIRAGVATSLCVCVCVCCRAVDDCHASMSLCVCEHETWMTMTTYSFHLNDKKSGGHSSPFACANMQRRAHCVGVAFVCAQLD